MEVDVQAPLKQALAKAKSFAEAKDWAKAASAYEKAATLMSTWAEQAHGREAEERRKKMAIEYRQIAQRLRNGEATSDSSIRPEESSVIALNSVFRWCNLIPLPCRRAFPSRARPCRRA